MYIGIWNNLIVDPKITVEFLKLKDFPFVKQKQINVGPVSFIELKRHLTEDEELILAANINIAGTEQWEEDTEDIVGSTMAFSYVEDLNKCKVGVFSADETMPDSFCYSLIFYTDKTSPSEVFSQYYPGYPVDQVEFIDPKFTKFSKYELGLHSVLTPINEGAILEG
jgi:hypothetical protein